MVGNEWNKDLYPSSFVSVCLIFKVLELKLPDGFEDDPRWRVDIEKMLVDSPGSFLVFCSSCLPMQSGPETYILEWTCLFLIRRL